MRKRASRSCRRGIDNPIGITLLALQMISPVSKERHYDSKQSFYSRHPIVVIARKSALQSRNLRSPVLHEPVLSMPIHWLDHSLKPYWRTRKQCPVCPNGCLCSPQEYCISGRHYRRYWAIRLVSCIGDDYRGAMLNAASSHRVQYP